ncbi:MAG: hypothetical protein V4819_02960 [Verrucomicrobiota bacterium]
MGDDGNPALGGFADFGEGVGVVLPGVEDFRRFLADAVHLHQAVRGGSEDGSRISAERFEQTPDPHRPDFWQHVEGDEGFPGSHVVDRLSIDRAAVKAALRMEMSAPGEDVRLFTADYTDDRG